MPNLRIVHEDARTIRFATPHAAGLGVVLLGAAVAYAVHRFAEAGTAKTAGLGIAIFFAAAGLFGWVWRDRIEFDLSTRRWTRTRGFFLSPTTTQGSLSEITGISIELDWERVGRGRSRRKVAEWEVGIVFEPEDRPITFVETRDEMQAYRAAESCAMRLGVNLLDRTSNREAPRSSSHIDTPAAGENDRLASRAARPPVLPGGRRPRR